MAIAVSPSRTWYLRANDGNQYGPVDGIIIGHATLPVVHQGEALFHIARIANAEKVGQRIESITDAIYASEPEGPAEQLLDEDEVI